MCAKETNIIAPFGRFPPNWPVNQVQNMSEVKTFMSIFEGNINPGDPQGLKLYLQDMKDIEK